MKVLLLNSAVARRSPHAQLSPPLGIAYLGAYLREQGHQVELIDLNLDSNVLQHVAAVMKRLQPDLVGLSVLTETYGTAIRCATLVKELAPDVPVVFGGAHPSILPEGVLAEPAVDFVIVGEGEEPLAELVTALELGSRDYASIRGLGYVDEDGAVHVNERAETGDPDSYPWPARDLLPLMFYESPYSILTARGSCPYNCAFCSASFIWSGRRRQRDPKAVVEELRSLVMAFGAINVFFSDDIFTLSRQWLDEFLNEMEPARGMVTWGCATRADLVDEEMLAKMADKGCTGIQFGIESGSQEILDSVKGITKEAARDAVKWSVAAGIKPTVSFMVPLPDDTEETLRETFAFIGELSAAGATPSVSYTAPFPGTLFYDQADELGLTILTQDWEQYDCKHVIMETRSLSADDVERIAEECAAGLGLGKNV